LVPIYQHWQLHYEKDAKAVTDVPPDLWTLIRQRRRWLNGSLFATVYVLLHFGRFWAKSRHNVLRKLCVGFLFVYYMLNILFNWFALANFFILFDCVLIEARILLLESMASSSPEENDNTSTLTHVHTALVLAYIFIAVGQFVVALGSQPQQASIFYYSCTLFFGVSSYMLIIMLVFAFLKHIDIVAVFGLVCLCSWVLIGALNYELLTSLLCVSQYIFLMPAFQLLFAIYSFCNLHDISWGTKGLETAASHTAVSTSGLGGKQTAAEEQQEQRERQHAVLEHTTSVFAQFRSSMLLCLVVSNTVLVCAYQMLYRRHVQANPTDVASNNGYLIVVLVGTVGMFAFQFSIGELKCY
jgi:chitin synthase